MRQVASFLDIKVDDAEVAKVVHHCSFDQMKINPAVNNETLVVGTLPGTENIKFMRKGQVCDTVTSASQKSSFLLLDKYRHLPELYFITALNIVFLNQVLTNFFTYKTIYDSLVLIRNNSAKTLFGNMFFFSN